MDRLGSSEYACLYVEIPGRGRDACMKSQRMPVQCSDTRMRTLSCACCACAQEQTQQRAQLVSTDQHAVVPKRSVQCECITREEACHRSLTASTCSTEWCSCLQESDGPLHAMPQRQVNIVADSLHEAHDSSSRSSSRSAGCGRQRPPSRVDPWPIPWSRPRAWRRGVRLCLHRAARLPSQRVHIGNEVMWNVPTDHTQLIAGPLAAMAHMLVRHSAGPALSRLHP